MSVAKVIAIVANSEKSFDKLRSLSWQETLVDISRRDLLKAASVSGLVVAGLAASEAVERPLLAQNEPTQAPVKSGEMIYRTLGRTGEKVSVLGLGGHHIGRLADEQESIQLIRAAIDRGINFMDNCWDYHNGASEIRMGKALQGGYRDRVFLMTKIDGRTKQAATQQINESLKRLQTDRIDLLQHHEIIRMEDPDRVFAPDLKMDLTVKLLGWMVEVGEKLDVPVVPDASPNA